LVRRHAARVQSAAERGSILITVTVDRVAALAMTGRPNLPRYFFLEKRTNDTVFG
jgi:hypothetical protein